MSLPPIHFTKLGLVITVPLLALCISIAKEKILYISRDSFDKVKPIMQL